MSFPRTYLEIHTIHDVPPSNLNRDDSGSPKSAIYGGVERSRISSQALKRAARMSFEEGLDPVDRSVRTREMKRYFVSDLKARSVEDELAESAADAAVTALGIKNDAKKDRLSYLLYLGEAQRQAMSDQIVQALKETGEKETKALEKVLKELKLSEQLHSGHPLGVALFGRMVADHHDLTVDASTQVAHAISTHAVSKDFDYFTAVDDGSTADEAGAGMIGTVEFSSSTMYRFGVVGMHQLQENLGERESAITGAVSFAKHFATALPSGKQNSFAALTRPALVLFVVRSDQPMSLVGAFEKPVDTRSGEGITVASCSALATHFAGETQRWGEPPVAVISSYRSDLGSENSTLSSAFGQSVDMNGALEVLEQSLRGCGE